MSSWQTETKKKLSIKAFHTVFLVVGLVCAVLSFVFSVFSKVKSNGLEDKLDNQVGGLENDLIFDILVQPMDEASAAQYPSDLYYQQIISHDWPGTTTGCFCAGYDLRREVETGLKSRECSKTETAAGCIRVPPIPARKLSIWKFAQSLVLIKGTGTSFNRLKNKLTPEGICPEGFRMCGDSSSLSKGICVPTVFTKCPITDILVNQTISVESLSVESLSDFRQWNIISLQLKRTEGKKPLSDISIVQDHSCLNRRSLPLSDGRRKYELLQGDFEHCLRDPTVWYLDSLGEVDFFRKNDILVQNLIKYSMSNDYQYRIAVSPVIDWSANCADLDPNLSGQTKDFKKLRDHLQLLFILFTVSLSVFAAASIATVWSVAQEKFMSYKIATIARFCSFVLVGPSLVICFVGSLSLSKSMTDLGDQHCAPAHLASIYADISTDINSALKRNLLVSIIFYSLSLVVEVSGAAVFLLSHASQLQKLGIKQLPEKPEPSSELVAGNLMNNNFNDSIDADKPNKPNTAGVRKTYNTPKSLQMSQNGEQIRPFKNSVFRRKYKHSIPNPDTPLLVPAKDRLANIETLEADNRNSGTNMLAHSLPPTHLAMMRQPDRFASTQKSAREPGSGAKNK